MNKQALRELRARVERCTGADRELDAALIPLHSPDGHLWFPEWSSGNVFIRRPDKGTAADYELLPHWTASIDDALALVERKRIEMKMSSDWTYALLARALVRSWNWWRNDADLSAAWIPKIPLAIISGLLSALEAQAE